MTILPQATDRFSAIPIKLPKTLWPTGPRWSLGAASLGKKKITRETVKGPVPCPPRLYSSAWWTALPSCWRTVCRHQHQGRRHSKDWDSSRPDRWVDRSAVRPEASTEPFSNSSWYLTTSIPWPPALGQPRALPEAAAAEPRLRGAGWGEDAHSPPTVRRLDCTGCGRRGRGPRGQADT